MHYPNPYDEPQEVNPPTMPGRHTKRAAETLAGGPTLPSAGWIREMERRDKVFRRKRFLREAGFWLLMAAAVGMCAWAILRF